MGFLNKKRISKSVLYYLSETIIVTIGIFIAIQLNNLNEKRKNKQEEMIALQRISSDLTTEKYVLETMEKQFGKSRQYLIDVAYRGVQNNLDSILFHFTPFIHLKVNAEYVSLKNSGKLHLITNDTLRYNLVNYYEVYYAAFAEISEMHKTHINGRTLDYFNSEFSSDTTSLIQPEVVKQKLKDTKFKNLINDQITVLSSISQYLQTDPIDMLIEMINNEIQTEESINKDEEKN